MYIITHISGFAHIMSDLEEEKELISTNSLTENNEI